MVNSRRGKSLFAAGRLMLLNDEGQTVRHAPDTIARIVETRPDFPYLAALFRGDLNVPLFRTDLLAHRRAF